MQTHSLQPLVIWNNIQVLTVIIYRHRRAQIFQLGFLSRTEFCACALSSPGSTMESDVFRPVTRLNFTSLACWNRQFVHGDITAEAEACSVSQRTQVDCDRVLRSCCRGPLFSLSSAVFSLRLCVKPSGELPQNSTLWCQQTDVNILLKQQQTVSKTVLWRSSIFRTFQAEWNVCISTYIWTTAFIRFWRQAFLQNNT